MINSKIAAFAVTTLVALTELAGSARADVYWNGGTSSDWSLAANWTGGLPSAGGAGNAVVNSGSPNISPVVSTTGNTTAGQTYISIGVGLSVVSGGDLTTSDLITGIWGDSLPVNISGGSLTMNGTLNMGAGGYAGAVAITGGTNTAIWVADNGTLTVSNGSLIVISSLDVAGYNGNTAILNVSAGSLNVGALSLNAAGKNTGASYLNLTGGTITQLGPLNINTAHPAILDISGGTLILPNSNLASVNYWVANHIITAYGGTGTVNVDSISNPGNLILTGTPGASITTRYWNGNVSSSWTDGNNFQSLGSNLPGVPTAGNTLHLESWGAREPVINNAGNAALSDVHVNKSMTITNGGALATTTFTLAESGSAALAVNGGSLSAGNYLDLGGYNGATAIMNLSGGSVTVGNLYLNLNGDTNYLSNGSQLNLTGGTLTDSGGLSNNESHPCLLNLSGGSLVLPVGQLANFNFWATDGSITAYGMVATTNSFNMDQTTLPGSLVITANNPGFAQGTFTQWNPEVFSNLPPTLDQAMPLVPPGMAVLTNAYYSFGTSVATNGDVYFTSFGTESINKYSPGSGILTTIVTNRPGVYGIAVDQAGNVFYGQDFGAGGQVVRRTPGGTEQIVITNLAAPRQLTTDLGGNLYAISEGAQIVKWTKNTGLTTILLNRGQMPVVPQGVAVTPDGRVYFCTYATGGGAGTELTQGTVWVLQTNGVVRVIAGGISRGRGLALDPKGNLYVATESSVWDDGNSGVLAKLDTNGVLTVVLSGIDYPQFPACGPDGKVYFTLPRDNKLVSYDPQNSFTPQAISGHGLTMTAQGANWLSSAGNNFPIQLAVTDTNNPADAVTISGFLKLTNGAGTVNLWLNLPVTNFSISLAQTPDPNTGNTNSGNFALPAISVNWAYGASTGYVLPLRRHQRCRWPMLNVSNGSLIAPAPDFSEAPVSYLAYVTLVAPPTLTIQLWTGGQVRIAWPTSAAGYSLQRSTTVNTGYASPGLTVTVEGSQNAVYDTPGNGARFYRLVK